MKVLVDDVREPLRTFPTDLGQSLGHPRETGDVRKDEGAFEGLDPARLVEVAANAL